MKKTRIFAVLAAMAMGLAVFGCSNGDSDSSGGGSSGGSTSGGGSESGTPGGSASESAVFRSINFHRGTIQVECKADGTYLMTWSYGDYSTNKGKGTYKLDGTFENGTIHQHQTHSSDTLSSEWVEKEEDNDITVRDGKFTVDINSTTVTFTKVGSSSSSGSGTGSESGATGGSTSGSGTGSEGGSTGGSSSGGGSESGTTGGTTSDSIEPVAENFVKIPGASIDGTEKWTPESEVFESGRKLKIASFYMSDHEVTRGEYKAVMGSDPSETDAYGKDGKKLTGDAAKNNPVTDISWYDALVYCNKLSIKKGLTPCYVISGSTNPDDWGSIPTSWNNIWDAATCDFAANGYRLPTEAEWEWAARGGESCEYAGSDTIDEVAWYYSNTKGTRDVKTKKANAYKLYDMSGNVGEWCWDLSGDISSDTPSTGPASGYSRVQRGGTWDCFAFVMQVADRSSSSPSRRDNDHNYGFRLVRSASGTTGGASSGSIEPVPEVFVKIPAALIGGTETWTPESEVFVSGRKLEIASFYMSDHEVTRGEYKAVMGIDPCGFYPLAYDKDGKELIGDAVKNNPVNSVSWYDALVYCNTRSIKEGLTPCYVISGSTNPDDWGSVPRKSNSTWDAATCDFTADGYRLPTEAEWEWAARGGESYTYAGSNDVYDVAWYNMKGTRDVKTKKANTYGLYDMSGNVMEWCWDWYDENISSNTASAVSASDSYRCQRGGSWDDGASLAQVACRHGSTPYRGTFFLRKAGLNQRHFSAKGNRMLRHGGACFLCQNLCFKYISTHVKIIP